jgi:hypothetical protein
MSGFPTDGFIRTGKVGIIIDIGRNKELGASRAINLDTNNRDRNWDIKGKSTINTGLMSSDTRNHNNSIFNLRDSTIIKSSRCNNSIFNLKASNTRENHNTISLKENMKEEKNIEGRRTGSKETFS